MIAFYIYFIPFEILDSIFSCPHYILIKHFINTRELATNLQPHFHPTFHIVYLRHYDVRINKNFVSQVVVASFRSKFSKISPIFII